jgi:hypothetical protein
VNRFSPSLDTSTLGHRRPTAYVDLPPQRCYEFPGYR